jgi:uncharacterized protein YbjT (DUF2867 family)
MLSKTAVIAGSTGLIGTRLVELLVGAPEYARVIALTRRPDGTASGTLQLRSADFDHLDTVLGDVRGSASTPLDVFCCLGTTIKTAGSEDAFRRVDFDYVVSTGRWAHHAAARRFILVSALGADSASRVFYNRVKGDAEQAVRNLGLASVVILRPSLLDGERKEFRRGERLTLTALRPVRELLPRSIRPVRDVDVAATMLAAARMDQAPPVIGSAQMHRAAARLGTPASGSSA